MLPISVLVKTQDEENEDPRMYRIFLHLLYSPQEIPRVFGVK